MPNTLEKKASWRNTLTMNSWLDYAVPKKHFRLYVNALVRNMLVFLFLTILLIGKLPSGLSILTLIIFTDFIFYNMVTSGGNKWK
jgi:hypothetical protein